MLAFLQNDKAGMQQEVAWATGKTGVEDVLLVSEATYLGLLRTGCKGLGSFPTGRWPQPSALMKRRRRQVTKRMKPSQKLSLAIGSKLETKRRQHSVFQLAGTCNMQRRLPTGAG